MNFLTHISSPFSLDLNMLHCMQISWKKCKLCFHNAILLPFWFKIILASDIFPSLFYFYNGDITTNVQLHFNTCTFVFISTNFLIAILPISSKSILFILFPFFWYFVILILQCVYKSHIFPQWKHSAFFKWAIFPPVYISTFETWV